MRTPPHRHPQRENLRAMHWHKYRRTRRRRRPLLIRPPSMHIHGCRSHPVAPELLGLGLKLGLRLGPLRHRPSRQRKHRGRMPRGPVRIHHRRHSRTRRLRSGSAPARRIAQATSALSTCNIMHSHEITTHVQCGGRRPCMCRWRSPPCSCWPLLVRAPNQSHTGSGRAFMRQSLQACGSE